MGRPQRNTVDFFPHFPGDGKKMFFIEKKYGNDGYATWFKILEKLAITNFHYLNLNEDEEMLYLSAKCNITEQTLLAIINDLARVGAFDKNLWEKRIIWSQRFIDEIQEAYHRRNNKCITYDGLCKHLIDLCILKPHLCKLKGDINTQSRVDKSREERIDTSSAPPSDGIYPSCIDSYNEFIIRQTGVGAKINAKEGAAMKKIIKYLKSQVKKKDGITEEAAVPEAFSFILANFEHWGKFEQSHLNISQIESNLINILNAIRNGKPKSSSKDIGQKYRT